jgi:wyosine [tRNA(Phe)-imidazoG37] synthetase (radical SAM superfamily)
MPFKTCTYDCVYCQLGRTTNKTVDRREYIAVDAVMEEMERNLAAGDLPDTITLSGSGEPTLNAGIGDLIGNIKSLTNLPLAVLTNGSLLWMDDVQDALMAADLVLPSLDAGDEYSFRYVNRPHEEISLERVVEGIAAFTRRFPGEVWLEVFLLAGVTGITSEARKIAALARHIGPARVQLNTVFRPPAEEFAYPVSADRMPDLKRLFPGRVELIGGANIPGGLFPVFRDARVEDILDLLGRRPCTPLDLANGLGIPVPVTLKHLDVLRVAGKVDTVAVGGRIFYIATRMQKACGQ